MPGMLRSSTMLVNPLKLLLKQNGNSTKSLQFLALTELSKSFILDEYHSSSMLRRGNVLNTNSVLKFPSSYKKQGLIINANSQQI